MEFIISTLCSEEANTSFHFCLRMMHPTHGISHVHLCSDTGTSNTTDLLSHYVTEENHLEFISTICKEEANTTFQFCLRLSCTKRGNVSKFSKPGWYETGPKKWKRRGKRRI
jgi:hypothetical protein